MNADRIDTLADLAASQIRALILEARDSITESVNAALEEAQEAEDGKAMLRLSPSIVWDLDGSSVVVKLNVTTKRKFEATASLDDPNQTKLSLLDADGDPMPDEARNAVQKLANAIRGGGGSITMGEVVEAKKAIEDAQAKLGRRLV